MINDTNVIGNSSSIFKTIGLTIAGYTTPWLIKLVLQYLGIDLSGQETQIMQLLGVFCALLTILPPFLAFSTSVGYCLERQQESALAR